MNAPSISKAEREDSAKLLRTEVYNLISEIERLTRQREMLSDRLDNAIHLVRIQDSSLSVIISDVFSPGVRNREYK